MKWLKKWYYLILLLGAGVLYLSCVDKWQVYAGPAATVKGWYDVLTAENRGGSDGERPEGQPADGEPADSRQTGGEQSNNEQPDGQPAGENPVPGDGETSPEGTGEEGAVEAGDAHNGQTGEEGQTGEDGQAEQNNTPSYITVEDDYFADAVFIGDSRTVGMHDYGGLEEISTFYASTGLTVYKMFTAEIVSVPGQKKKITIEEALQQNSFAKIYLMIGINEMGTGNVDTFIEKYAEVVDHLKELQPDAIIYLQGIMKVTTKRSEQGDYINNEGIIERNERIAQLADNKRVFYLDVNPLICDESGGMDESYTYDGVHLKGKHIEIWKQYLKEHVIER